MYLDIAVIPIKIGHGKNNYCIGRWSRSYTSRDHFQIKTFASGTAYSSKLTKITAAALALFFWTALLQLHSLIFCRGYHWGGGVLGPPIKQSESPWLASE